MRALEDDEPSLPSVLVVDDRLENLRLLSDLLGAQGYEVRAVTNGRQALQAVEHDPPDLILLDINMPEMNGYEVCRRLRVKERSRDVPVIFLTALDRHGRQGPRIQHGRRRLRHQAFSIRGSPGAGKDARCAQALASGAGRKLHPPSCPGTAARRSGAHGRPRHVVAAAGSAHQPPALEGRVRRAQRRQTGNPAVSVRVDRRAQRDDERLVRREPDSGVQIPVKRAMWDLTRMARDVRSVMAAIGAERAIDIESAGAVEVSCDGALIRRVMENFVNNGIRHTPAGSPMRISIASGGGRVRVAVHDQGHGVPPEAREKIFEKFGTVEVRQESNYHSSGWVSRSASSRSRPMAEQSEWIRACRPAARSGSSCPPFSTLPTAGCRICIVAPSLASHHGSALRGCSACSAVQRHGTRVCSQAASS